MLLLYISTIYYAINSIKAYLFAPGAVHLVGRIVINFIFRGMDASTYMDILNYLRSSYWMIILDHPHVTL